MITQGPPERRQKLIDRYMVWHPAGSVNSSNSSVACPWLLILVWPRGFRAIPWNPPMANGLDG
jgi:hypothetical protein